MNMAEFFKKAVVIFAALFLSLGLVGERAEAAGALGTTVPIIFIDDEELLLDVPPQILNGRVLVPLRGVFEKLGAVVVWEPETGSITISDSSKKFELSAKSQVVTINNEKHNLDVAPFIINGRTMIPLRFVSENLSAKVDWIAASKTVKIFTNPLYLIESNSGEELKSPEYQTIMEEEAWETSSEQITVGLVVADSTVTIGQSFNVQIWVKDVVDLYTTEVQMAYDPSFLKVTSIKGEFLGGSDIIKLVDKKAGTIHHVSTKLGQVPGKNGDGVLTNVTFEALMEGSTEISFTGNRVQMVSSLGKFIDYSEKTTSIEINIK